MMNVNNGGDSSSIGISIRMSVDGQVISADSGEIVAEGCSLDTSYPSYFACNDLAEGQSQTPFFTWTNPTPGEHTITFTAACQLVPVQNPTAYCDSFGTTISTTTLVGASPTADAGPDQQLIDTDNDGTEDVLLDGSASTSDNGIVSYEWFEQDTLIGTGETLTVALSSGRHSITLRITDNNEYIDEDDILIDILTPPTADAGPDQELTDNDNSEEEEVLLDGSASTSDNYIVSHEWFEGDTFLGTGETLTVALAVGVHNIILRVTDNNNITDEDDLVINILSPPSPPDTLNADAGPDQQLTDSNNDNSEEVLLDGTGSSDLDGDIVSYEWFEFDTQIATGATPTIALDVGTHELTLRVTDSDTTTDEDQVVISILPGPNTPTADAGPDQALTDSDNSETEDVALDGTGSMDSDGRIVSYVWFEGGTQIATGATPTVSLSVGEHTLTLRVTDNTDLFSEDQVSISITAAPRAPIADAGQDLALTDTDNDGSEQVTLDATASSDADGTIVSYQWLENGTEIASGATPTITLPVGTRILTLRVTDNDDLVGEDQLIVSIATDTTTPIANAGTDQTLVDRDGDGSVLVALDGTGSADPDGTIISYTWYEGNSEIATGATPTVLLNTGAHTLTLVVRDDAGLTHQDQITISINGDDSQLQIISGTSLTGSSGDTVGPFTVRLVDQNGTPVTDSLVVWHVIPENAATLSESESTTDQEGQASTSMNIQQTGVIKLLASHNTTTVEYVINSIAETPGLTNNQQAVGSSMDNLCPSLAEKQADGNLTAAEQDLLMTCEDLVTEPGTASTLSRLAPEEVAAQGTASVEAAGTQLTNINRRLVALRSGDLGMNLSGLTVNYGGIAFNQRLFDGLFPKDKRARGGGAGDIDELQGRWGAFINGNVNFGDKDETQRETGFDFDTRGITLGLDYRFNERLVAGGALGFSRYDSDYNDAAGNLEMDAWSLSAYGTYYQDNNIYVDGLIQIGSNNYDTKRRINAAGEADQFGQGDTDGTEYAFNISAGYDYRRNTWTLTPYGRLSYTRAEIDAYTEEASNLSAAGFGSVLRIDDQELKSIVLVVGGNFSYTVSTAHAVLMPQLRFEWEHEFEDDSRFINARFVNDPTRSGFAIETDKADTDYFNLGIGLSAVFSQGRSGYLFYETRLNQDDVTLHMINGGLRIEF
ncbi:MAG: autotransporter domain-containing protein [Candidatus Thiodiazotropha sp.]|jgi:outer membrane autotransporter protein